jgi:hypothetical protein
MAARPVQGRRQRNRITRKLRQVPEDYMLWQIPVRQVLFLQLVLIPFVSIRRIAPYGVADKPLVSGRDCSSQRKLVESIAYSIVDASNDVPPVLKSLKELYQFWISLGNEGPIRVVRGHHEVV